MRRAETLFQCYRREEAVNADAYCAAVAAVLGDGYSREVVEYVTDPRTGLPSRQKFLPNIAEIREALDARAEQLYRLGTYEERIAEQLRLRDEWKDPNRPQTSPRGVTWKEYNELVERGKARRPVLSQSDYARLYGGGQQPQSGPKNSAQSWLDRTDPRAQQLSGQGPRKKYTDAEKEAFLEDAKKVGQEISGMKLRPETLGALKEQDELRSLLSDPPTDGEK